MACARLALLDANAISHCRQRNRCTGLSPNSVFATALEQRRSGDVIDGAWLAALFADTDEQGVPSCVDATSAFERTVGAIQDLVALGTCAEHAEAARWLGERLVYFYELPQIAPALGFLDALSMHGYEPTGALPRRHDARLVTSHDATVLMWSDAARAASTARAMRAALGRPDIVAATRSPGRTAV